MVKVTESHGDKPTEVKQTSSSVDLDKIASRAVSAKARDYPNFPNSQSGGVVPMSIQSKFAHERQRLSTDFTDKWRKWRAQWIKDQTLHPAEPMHVEALEREFYNPIRRAYRAPWNWFEMKLSTVMGPVSAHKVRLGITTVIWLYSVTFTFFYICKYHQRTWEDGSRAKWPMIYASREAVYPGDPAYPNIGVKFRKEEFADLGFSERKALLFKGPNVN